MVSNCPKLKMYYVRYCKILRKVTGAAKRNYYDKLLDPAENKENFNGTLYAMKQERCKMSIIHHRFLT
jgi:hypothetical protein